MHAWAKSRLHLRTRTSPLLLVALVTAGCANGGGDQFTNTVYATNRMARDLDQNVGPAVTELNQKTADLNLRMDEAERQVRQIEGTLQENTVRLAQVQERLDELRMTLYRHFGVAPGASRAPETTPPPGTSVPAPGLGMTPPGDGGTPTPAEAAPAAPPAAPRTPASPEDLYTEARERYIEEDYQAALSTFDDYLNRYPDSRKAVDALYWKGKSLGNIGRHEEAIGVYRDVQSKFPTSPRAPSAIFEAAQSMLQMNRRDEAQAMLNDLVTNYPMTDPADQARRVLESLQRN